MGTNLYLTKIALDITAKHIKDDLGYLNEEIYKATLWDHQLLTDFWHIGNGIANRLAQMGILTMKQLAFYPEHASIQNVWCKCRIPNQSRMGR